MATKKRKVTLEGVDALTIPEARQLIKAAMDGRMRVCMPGDVHVVESACEKVAQGLIAAGQDREMVQQFLLDCTLG